MSHELRTPLNAILGYAQILGKDSTLTEEHRDGIHVIQRSGEHLLNLIDEILDLSKIEAGEQDLEPSDFHLIEFLSNVVDIVRIRARAKGIDFLYEPLGELPLFAVSASCVDGTRK